MVTVKEFVAQKYVLSKPTLTYAIEMKKEGKYNIKPFTVCL